MKLLFHLFCNCLLFSAEEG